MSGTSIERRNTMRCGASYCTMTRTTMSVDRGRKHHTASTAQIHLYPPQWLQIHSPIPTTLLHPPSTSFATTILDTTTTAITTTTRSSSAYSPNYSNVYQKQYELFAQPPTQHQCNRQQMMKMPMRSWNAPPSQNESKPTMAYALIFPNIYRHSLSSSTHSI